MKAILLARVSSREQEEGQSIPAQVRRLTEYALRKNLTIEDTIPLTESSTKETRKQFDAIIAMIKQRKEPIALVTDTVDRLQRSFRETPLLDDLRKQGKLELHFLREGLIVGKESNSAQLLQWDIGVLFASSYVRQHSDNIKRSIEQGWRNGEWFSLAPLGYKNVALPDGKKNIAIDPETAHLVIKMFQLYASGVHSLSTIVDEMYKLGLRTSDGKPVALSKVERILKNTFYYGVMKVKGILYPHKYESLISEELFNVVQEQLTGHQKRPVHFVAKPILLRGLISCGNCDCTVTGDIKKGRYTYYSCNNSKRICKRRWIREEILLTPMLEYLDRLYLSDQQVSDIVTFLQEACAADQTSFKQSQDALKKELHSLQTRISKLIDMHLDGKIDSETYHAKLEEYKQRQRFLTAEIKVYDQSPEASMITAQTVMQLAQQAKAIFLGSKLEIKQQILRCIFSNSRLIDEKLDLELYEPFSTLAKIKDHPKWWRRWESNPCPH